MSEVWINNKKGTGYIVTNKNVVNSTNAQDGEKMWLYVSMKNPEDVFVRTEEEFLAKFTKRERM